MYIKQNNIFRLSLVSEIFCSISYDYLNQNRKEHENLIESFEEVEAKTTIEKSIVMKNKWSNVLENMKWVDFDGKTQSLHSTSKMTQKDVNRKSDYVAASEVVTEEQRERSNELKANTCLNMQIVNSMQD
ncbi:CLUMA_CG010093, isoform A [Clunio marinus]|uniref:CLUMA_CG010093, isoform A n=1 Tax=Clunio marinus TaxID=568069 RepID=A0A1J1IAC8_9DIPT|nr:CLUMA_CG010093, isoform A [Clunio marinus]